MNPPLENDVGDSGPVTARDVPGSVLHFAAYRAIEWLAATLPRDGQYRVARAVAAYWCKLDSGSRRTVEEHMRAVLGSGAPPGTIRANARGVFQSFARYLCEFIGQRNQSAALIDANVTVIGREHLDAALKIGRGAICCSGHYSNWELGASAIARLGYPITAVVQKHSNARIDALFVERRERAGVKIAHTDTAALNALRALKRNETIAILGDRPTGGPTVALTLFGRETQLPQGPWRLALLSGAVLVPSFVRRDGERYVLEFDAPLTLSGYSADASRDERVKALAAHWARCFESRVRSDPTQWTVFDPVWKR